MHWYMHPKQQHWERSMNGQARKLFPIAGWPLRARGGGADAKAVEWSQEEPGALFSLKVGDPHIRCPLCWNWLSHRTSCLCQCSARVVLALTLIMATKGVYNIWRFPQMGICTCREGAEKAGEDSEVQNNRWFFYLSILRESAKYHLADFTSPPHFLCYTYMSAIVYIRFSGKYW